MEGDGEGCGMAPFGLVKLDTVEDLKILPGLCGIDSHVILMFNVNCMI